jgi:excisionase family DNA binding protein
MADLALALIDAFDDSALDALADRLAPRLASLATHGEQSSDDRWLNTADAATYLGISANALHKLTAQRAIPFEQDGTGCKLYFKRSKLDDWRQSGGTRSQAPRRA